MDFVFFRAPARTLLAAVLAVTMVAVTLLSGWSVPVAHAQSDDLTISADGVGNAELGVSAEELSDALGDEYEVSDEVRITVDFNGRVISKDGEVQFRAAATGPGDELNLFIVSNADYAIAEGVGPETTIADAEAILGEATLNWNPDDEGREFVSFENGPEGRIQFRTPGIAGTNVGIYADDEFETTEYASDAVIAAVWVSCCLLYTSPSPRDRTRSRMPSSA